MSVQCLTFPQNKENFIPSTFLKIRKISSSIQGVQLIGYAGSIISKTFSLNLSINSIDFPVTADTMSGVYQFHLWNHTHYNSALIYPQLFLDNLFSLVINFSKLLR